MDWVTLIQHLENINGALVPLEEDIYNNYNLQKLNPVYAYCTGYYFYLHQFHFPTLL